VSLSSDLMAALILRSPACEYLRLVEMTPEKATYAAKRKNGVEVRYTFSWKDAERAGLTSRQTYRNNPADMLRHRALSKIARAVFPDVVAGLYTRDELTDAVTGDVVDTSVQTAEAAPAAPKAVEAPKASVRRRPTASAAPVAPIIVVQAVTEATVDVAEVAETSDIAELEAVQDVEATVADAAEGSVLDPLTGEVLEGAEANLFARVQGVSTTEELVSVSKLIADAKAWLDNARYESLGYAYFERRAALTGKPIPDHVRRPAA
jgi:hypothetical protein